MRRIDGATWETLIVRTDGTGVAGHFIGEQPPGWHYVHFRLAPEQLARLEHLVAVAGRIPPGARFRHLSPAPDPFRAACSLRGVTLGLDVQREPGEAGRRALSEVELWTDGACSGNPGPGGWAALLRMGPHERELSGGEELTTNNRMELTGVVHGLKALTRPCRVRVYIDSSYVKNAFTNGWLARWQRNGWATLDKRPVKNRELWHELLAEVGRHEVEWVKVAGHAGVECNERVDRLACAERDRHAQRAATQPSTGRAA